MKKIISIYGIMGSLLIAMLPGVSSCDKLEDELFKKNTYIIHNGWQDYSLEVADDNTTVLPVYFGVNGTSGNDKEIHIMMEVRIIRTSIRARRIYIIKYCRKEPIRLMPIHGILKVEN